MASESTQDRAIGRLEGKLDTLIGHFERSERTAAENRAKVYERIEATALQTGKIAETLRHIDGRVAAAEASASAAHDKAAAIQTRLDGIGTRTAKLMGIGTGIGVGFGLSFHAIKAWFTGPHG